MLFCSEMFEGDPRACLFIGVPDMPCLVIG